MQNSCFQTEHSLIPDDIWVVAAAQAIKKEGAEQFLVNMLHVLRLSLAGEME